MAVLHEAFSVAHAASLPGADWLRRRRTAAAESLVDASPPSPSEEEWRYSPVGDLSLRSLRPAPEPPPSTDGEPEEAMKYLLRDRPRGYSTLVLTCDGHLVDVRTMPDAAGVTVRPIGEELDPSGRLGGMVAEPRDVFGLMNDAYAGAPLLLDIPPGARPAEPVAVVNVVRASDVAVFPRLVVIVGEGADVQVVNVVVSALGRALVAPVTEIDVGAAARLQYLNIQDLSLQSIGIDHATAKVASQGHLDMGLAASGGAYARCRVDCALEGRGAGGDLSAMYFGEGDQVMDFRTFQNHVAPDTTSNLLFVGAVKDRARSIYSGLIRVGAKARGTDANQTNRILKLSEEVWADSVPNLEIENNDVRCAHASSVGPIDEDHRFYLESRGVPPEAAERLIVEGFFDEVRGRLPVQSVAARLDEKVRAKIGRDG